MTPEKVAHGVAYALALTVTLFVLAVLVLVGWKILIVLAHWVGVA